MLFRHPIVAMVTKNSFTYLKHPVYLYICRMAASRATAIDRL